MAIKGVIGDWFAALFIIALLYMLVRPQSVASDAVRLFGDAMVSLVRAATDL